MENYIVLTDQKAGYVQQQSVSVADLDRLKIDHITEKTIIIISLNNMSIT